MELDYLQALMGGTLEETPTISYRGIWVIAETRRGALARVTLEILGRARELADSLGVRVATVLIGHGVSDLAPQAIAHGSDVVFVADAPLFADYRTEAYLAPIAALIQERKPEIVLLGATGLGRDLAPALAGRFETGLLAECIALDIDESERLLVGTRRIYGGLMMETVVCPKARPQIATVLPGCLRPLPADKYRQGTTEAMPVAVQQSDLVATIEPTVTSWQELPLYDARIIISGGRGIGGEDGFVELKELAKTFDATVAASRSAVEFGWADRQRMVDVAGTLVQPDLYIAVGISGAFPHRMATRGTRCLVAINKNPKAPIFKRAAYGIVGDWREVVPALNKAVKEAKEA